MTDPLHSDESGVLLKTGHTGKTYIEILRLKQGNHEITEDILQPEGIGRTLGGSIYITSEPNLIVILPT
ncbi:TPA: SdiA-regulated domain-containing protein [Escherichia coli]